MNTNEIMIIGIVTGVVCFLISFFFFNKMIKLDRKSSDKDEDSVIFITSKYYKKSWMNNHIDTVRRMIEVNLIIQVLVDNDVIKTALDNNMKLSGEEGVVKIINYFIKDTEENKRLLSNIKQNKVSEIDDFSKKSLDYLDYFFGVNKLVDPIVFSLSHEVMITEKYASHKKARQRLKDLQFSLLALNGMHKRIYKENTSHDSQDDTVDDNKLTQH